MLYSHFSRLELGDNIVYILEWYKHQAVKTYFETYIYYFPIYIYIYIQTLYKEMGNNIVNFVMI